MLGPVLPLIRAKLVAAPLPAADVAFFREPFTRPKPPRPWALVRVVGGPEELRTLAPKGAARARQFGLVQVFVHVPKDKGQQIGADIADSFAALLQRIDDRGSDGTQLISDDARIDEGEDIVKDLADAYDVTLVSVPFEFHHGR